MAAISELGKEYGQNAPFAIAPFGQDPGEQAIDRFTKTYNLSRRIQIRSQGWSDKFAWSFLSLTALFGTRTISMEDVENYSSGIMADKMQILGGIVEKHEAGIQWVQFNDHIITDELTKSPQYGMIAAADKMSYPLVMGKNHDGAPSWVKFSFGFYDQPYALPMTREGINAVLNQMDGELFLISPR